MDPPCEGWAFIVTLFQDSGWNRGFQFGRFSVHWLGQRNRWSTSGTQGRVVFEPLQMAISSVSFALGYAAKLPRALGTPPAMASVCGGRAWGGQGPWHPQGTAWRVHCALCRPARMPRGGTVCPTSLARWKQGALRAGVSPLDVPWMPVGGAAHAFRLLSPARWKARGASRRRQPAPETRQNALPSPSRVPRSTTAFMARCTPSALAARAASSARARGCHAVAVRTRARFASQSQRAGREGAPFALVARLYIPWAV